MVWVRGRIVQEGKCLGEFPTHGQIRNWIPELLLTFPP